MGEYLTTTITSPQVIAAGGVLAGALKAKSPSAGNFYMLMEQYNAQLAYIPGSRAYLYQAAAGGSYVNNTTQHTTRTRAAGGIEEDITVALTVPNTDCYLYVFLKKRTSSVVAGSFVVGTTYEIMSIGTTDFTLIGATANTVGLTFAATGVGAGTGTAAELPDPDTDDTADYVVVTLQSTADVVVGGLDLAALMSLMITMMIVVMMMKMMAGVMGAA